MIPKNKVEKMGMVLYLILICFLFSLFEPFLTNFDGISEELTERDYSKQQYEIIFAMGLAEYHSEMRNHSFPGELEDWDEFGWIELTPQEQKLLDQLESLK